MISIADDTSAQWDFNMFYTAAHALADGNNPYAPLRPQWTMLLSLASAKLVWLALKRALRDHDIPTERAPPTPPASPSSNT